MASDRNAGFTILSATGATLIISALFLFSGFPKLQEYFVVRSAASSLVEELKKAQRLATGEDLDRRIRLTSERGYVREKRAGAGWLFEQAYVLGDGLEVSGPSDIEFQSHSALSPVALYRIRGPKAVRFEIVTAKDGRISLKWAGIV